MKRLRKLLLTVLLTALLGIGWSAHQELAQDGAKTIKMKGTDDLNLQLPR